MSLFDISVSLKDAKRGGASVQERLRRVKAAEQRRAEAEQTGEILHQTSCDSITQVSLIFAMLHAQA